MRKLRFMHIAKTAGTTFTAILKHQYPGVPQFEFSGDINADRERFAALSITEKKSVQLFTGHAPIMTGISEADDALLITILRDPVERVKSFCKHVYEGKSPYLLSSYPPENFSLDDFLSSGNGELSNLQTKMLINEGKCESPINIIPDTAAISLAFKNLNERISCYGLQELFDESLMVFRHNLQWRMPRYSKINRAGGGDILTFKEHHLSRIMELNSLDIRLYELAREQFLGGLNSNVFAQRKLVAFRLSNWFLGLF